MLRLFPRRFARIVRAFRRLLFRVLKLLRLLVVQALLVRQRLRVLVMQVMEAGCLVLLLLLVHVRWLLVGCCEREKRHEIDAMMRIQAFLCT